MPTNNYIPAKVPDIDIGSHCRDHHHPPSPILFRELDTNSDGGISLTEWHAWFHKLISRGQLEEAETRLEWIEDRIKTCDSVVTPTEQSLAPSQRISIDRIAATKLKVRAAAAFDLIDEKCSKDGEVSRDELLKVLKQERLGAKILFRELDTNSDGGISLVEWYAWFHKSVAKGNVDEAEARLEWIEDRINSNRSVSEQRYYSVNSIPTLMAAFH
eukprot:TRINITY_DN673_c0_g1_i8.p1 TRINITY_DN673_c0_g1~~TRINITY_DN673_c0_g1_i8.p1  ORF type:complete len:215 (+),score=44.36 TRINITY_DN673_c0_g1_i8:95-739(+)